MMKISILKKFNYRENLIKEYKNWLLLLRPEQTTLGSLVLIEKSFQKKYSKITHRSHQELGFVIKDIENTLKMLFGYNKINYLMLMMIDKEVHYHVIPRYSKDVFFEEAKFVDKGWPGLPLLNYNNDIKKNLKLKLINLIKFEMNK